MHDVGEIYRGPKKNVEQSGSFCDCRGVPGIEGRGRTRVCEHWCAILICAFFSFLFAVCVSCVLCVCVSGRGATETVREGKGRPGVPHAELLAIPDRLHHGPRRHRYCCMSRTQALNHPTRERASVLDAWIVFFSADSCRGPLQTPASPRTTGTPTNFYAQMSERTRLELLGYKPTIDDGVGWFCSGLRYFHIFGLMAGA